MRRSFAERAGFLVLSAALAVGAGALTNRDAYPVTEPYCFPVQPGTPEWTELSEAGLARNACRLPAGLAEQMTTGALLETALNDPYAIDLLAYDDPVRGFWINARCQDALAELVTRPDAAAVVEQAYEELPPLEEITDETELLRRHMLSVFSQGLAHLPEA